MLRTRHVCFGAKIRDKESARKKVPHGGHTDPNLPIDCSRFPKNIWVDSELHSPSLQWLGFSPVCPPTTCVTHFVLAPIWEVAEKENGGNTERYFHLNGKVASLGKGKFTFVRIVSFYRFHHMCVGANLRAKGRQGREGNPTTREEFQRLFTFLSRQSAVCILYSDNVL